MQFSNLRNVSDEEIRTTFNEAFREYLVPVHLTAEQLKQKLWVEGYTPNLSVGAFEDEQLIGQIIHAKGSWGGQPTAYNCGTGVIAAYRGQQLTQRMFAYILSVLKEQGIRKSLLEVIQGNDRALRTYTAVGFKAVRELDSYKGQLANPASDSKVVELAEPDWQQLQTFWNWQPSWQHSLACLKRAAGSYKTYAILDLDTVVAYATINPLTNRIPSFGVAPAYRRQGLGRRLFQHLQYHYSEKPLTLINIESTAADTLAFLQSLGLLYFLRQYEMELAL